MAYDFYGKGRDQTPQTAAIPGRANEMAKGKSGAVLFKVDVWVQLRRCLIMGTADSTFYSDRQELTEDFVAAVQEAIGIDAVRVGEEIVTVSDKGLAIKNSSCIFALVLLSCDPKPAAKQAFREAYGKVIRTGAHFHEWVHYTKQLRGVSTVVKNAGRSWLNGAARGENAEWLTYQFLKYPQRHGYTMRDHLRIFRPRPLTEQHDRLYSWAVKGWETDQGFPDVADPEFDPGSLGELEQLGWYEWAKRHPSQSAKAVDQGGLTHEMIAPLGGMTAEVWEKVFRVAMPLTATIRNLGSLTSLGVLDYQNTENLAILEQRLLNRESLRAKRVHPMQLLLASKVYQSGGALGASRKRWTPVPRVVDILQRALALSFETQTPTEKVFLHAIDVSGSMGSNRPSGAANSTCSEIAAVMALACAKTEPNYYIRGFSTDFKDLGITASSSFLGACNSVLDNTFGATDASVAYEWAIKNGVYVDCFCFWTDHESWAGHQHPAQALAKYRKKINPKAKAVYISLVTSALTLADPQDPMTFDLAGFDPTIPSAIQMIAEGRFDPSGRSN
jgi:60 kDa SS-A/Ro ribonucleoprotein